MQCVTVDLDKTPDYVRKQAKETQGVCVCFYGSSIAQVRVVRRIARCGIVLQGPGAAAAGRATILVEALLTLTLLDNAQSRQRDYFCVPAELIVPWAEQKFQAVSSHLVWDHDCTAATPCIKPL